MKTKWHDEEPAIKNCTINLRLNIDDNHEDGQEASVAVIIVMLMMMILIIAMLMMILITAMLMMIPIATAQRSQRQGATGF